MDDPTRDTLSAPELAGEELLSPGERALVRSRAARRLEESGEYEAARELLRPFWPDGAEGPEVAGLGGEAAAELLLRAGALTGWLGSSTGVGGAEEAAKDLLSRAAALFEEGGLAARADEARVELAYCYFREGALDEARVLLRESLARLGEGEEARLVALLRLAVVEDSATRFSDSLAILKEAAGAFEASASHSLKGRYHNQLAHALQSLGTSEQRSDYFDRAIIEFTAAGFHFEQARHTRFQARVENNLGLLLLSLGRFEESHEHLGRARRLFRALGDTASEAQVEETRARVLLAQGHADEAAETSLSAAGVFEGAGALSLLAEALTTHGRALARLGRTQEARAAFERAAPAAELAGSLEVAGLAVLTMCEELSSSLGAEELREAYVRADELLAGSQSPEILARLRRAARRALDAGHRSEEGAETTAAEESDALSVVGRLTREALGRAGKRVDFTPGALEAMGRLFLTDGLRTLRELLEESIAEAAPESSVSADDVEIVALRGRAPRGTFVQPWRDFSLKGELHEPERRFIELALRAAGGKISVAARLLGLEHNERLTSIIRSRYPDLLAARTPPVPRRRSIIRKPRR